MIKIYLVVLHDIELDGEAKATRPCFPIKAFVSEEKAQKYVDIENDKLVRQGVENTSKYRVQLVSLND